MHLKRSPQITKAGEIKRIPGGAHNKSSKDPKKHPSIHPSTTRLRGSYPAVTARSWEERAGHRMSERSTKRAFVLCFVFGPFWEGEARIHLQQRWRERGIDAGAVL
jgi:hypothetical protein